MPINKETLNRRLERALGRYEPKAVSDQDEVIPLADEADAFRFNFVKDGENYGVVYVTLDDTNTLTVWYNDNIMDSPESPTPGLDYDDTWTGFLKFMKRWAMNNQLSFKTDNKDRLGNEMARRKRMKEKEKISEGYYPMGKKASYSDAVPSVKIVLQHSKVMQEGEQRFRHIEKIFVENANGERFLVPTTKPGLARVFARHIAEGGTPYDERAGHIQNLVEEYNKMAGFVRATRNGQFNESAQQLVQEGINHYLSLRESLGKLTGHRGYTAYFESWTPPLMEDEADATAINELFVQETLDPRIESVMPILSRLHKQVAEMKEVSELSEWADSLIEDEGIQSQNPQGIPEGRLDGDADIDSPVADAITRRILLQRTDLLAKYGPEKVADAIATIADDMGDWIGPDDEIGSSDVSGWVKRVEQELSSLGEGEPGDLEHELERQDYEHDRERDEQAEKEMNEAERPGLWANIHAKRERIKHGSGEKMRKPGSKGAPTAQNFRDAAKEGIEEALDPEKKQRLQDLIDRYADATDPEYMGDDDYEDIIAQIRQEFGDRTADSIANGPSMHFPRPGHSMGHDDLEFKQMRKNLSPNRITKAGKLHRQDSDAMKRDIKNKFEVDEGLGDIAKKVGGALKTGAKAVGKAIVGPDDDELLQNLKKAAGVRNPQTGKPSMAHSDVEKVKEDLGPEQKRVGQLGPTEKVKNNNIGKLVGANESVELSEMDSEGYKGTRDDGDSKGKEGKAKPIKGKDFTKAAGKALDKEMDKAHKKDVSEGEMSAISKGRKAGKAGKPLAPPYPKDSKEHAEFTKGWNEKEDIRKANKLAPYDKKEVKEGQEDLDAILRIIRK